MLPLDPVLITKIIEECRDYKHTNSVPCFEGWKSGQHTESHLKNMSIAAAKRKRTPEHIAALHAGRKKSKNSIEHQQKLIEARTGAKHSNETRMVMSMIKKEAHANGTLWPEAKRNKLKIARALRNTPEYKKQQSEKMKEIWAKRRGEQT